jgi:hypothetical protein
VNSGDNFLIRFNDAPLVSLPAIVPIPKAIAAVNLGFSFMNAQKSLPYDFCRTFATADSQTLDASLALNAEWREDDRSVSGRRAQRKRACHWPFLLALIRTNAVPNLMFQACRPRYPATKSTTTTTPMM